MNSDHRRRRATRNLERLCGLPRPFNRTDPRALGANVAIPDEQVFASFAQKLRVHHLCRPCHTGQTPWSPPLNRRRHL